MSGHTREPWQVSGIRQSHTLYGHPVGPDGDHVTIIPYSPQHHTECLANARRICLSINACTGLSDESLEAGVIGKVRAALEPFADVDGEGDEDFPDETPVVVKFGRTTHYALTLGDFRKARAALALLQESSQ